MLLLYYISKINPVKIPNNKLLNRQILTKIIRKSKKRYRFYGDKNDFNKAANHKKIAQKKILAKFIPKLRPNCKKPFICAFLKNYNNITLLKPWTIIFNNNISFNTHEGYILILYINWKLLNYIRINLVKAKLFIFINSFIKCKKVTRSVFISEIYNIINGFNTGYVFKITLSAINEKLNLLLYEITIKKRFIINIIIFRKFYKSKEINKIKWIAKANNLTDIIIKNLLNKTLKNLINSNVTTVKIKEWPDFWINFLKIGFLKRIILKRL
ncbi:hypothetical protein MAPG_09562 [Magnaporthiopsis poae ATCC 64411]|uniref:Uncharacterized protein n=1 Tax=Magnaporthiopsis poae (strain ATCC 64411 / 73-15) TaxID=644358 RepID=A0A0C4EAA0_MAGP6|nr:hypothetical protein MAPG_09562 [Magnaporthiopsis poae ATCC 64411]